MPQPGSITATFSVAGATVVGVGAVLFFGPIGVLAIGATAAVGGGVGGVAGGVTGAVVEIINYHITVS